MAPVVPFGVPAELVAGDSLIFKQTYPEHPVSEGWTVSFTFNGVANLKTLSSEVTNDSAATWTVNVPASRTAELPSGTYRWFAYATGSSTYAGRRDCVDQGVIVLKQDPATAAAGDFRSHEEHELELIEAALLESAGDDIISYTIAGRQVTRGRKETLARRANLKRTVWRQQNPGRAYPTSLGVFSGV